MVNQFRVGADHARRLTMQTTRIERGAGSTPRRVPGFVVPAVIFGLVVMSVLSIAALRGATDQQRSANAYRGSTSAFYAAESGLRYVVGNWTTIVAATSPTVSSLSPGDSVVRTVSGSTWIDLGNHGGSYRTVIHRVDNISAGTQKVFLVVVQGRGDNKNTGQRALEAVISYTPVTTSMWNNAMLAAGDVVFGGSGSWADSYSSLNGPYNAATADSNATLRMNGDITLNSATVVKGNVVTHGTSPSTGTATVTGGITTGAATQTVPGVIPCPSGGYTPASALPSLGSSTYSSGDLIVKPSGLTLTGSSYYFHSLKVTDQLYISGTSHVDIYVEDYLTVSSGSAINNNSKLPGNLTIWACGSATKPGDFSMTGGGLGYYALYAPDRKVVVGGAGDMWGAVIGNNISFTGGSKFHYDKSLAGGSSPTTGYALISGGWVELTLY
jgi:Tfp pilus assembly protein PilX